MAAIERRNAIKLMSTFGAPFLAPFAAAAATSKSSQTDGISLGFDSETGILNALARIHGDAGGGLRYWYSDITRFTVVDHQTVPLFSQVGVQAVKYHVDQNSVVAKLWLCGYFLNTDDRQLITAYKNPFTNETNTVPIFRTGPGRIDWKNGSFVPPDDLPFEMQQRIGNVRTVRNQVWFDWNISSQLKWGNQRDFLTFNASIDDVRNPNLTSVPATYAINDIISWFDFMKMPMDKYPGFILGRGVGTKLESAQDLPPYLMKLVEQHDPMFIQDIEKWSGRPPQIHGA